MKVVEYGHIKPKYVFCHGCGAILEFTPADQHISNRSLQKGIQNDGKDYIIQCPVCTRATYDSDFKDSPDEC